jgi:sigma-B regulation protein RsbU (phosphoserine phosphatase)
MDAATASQILLKAEHPANAEELRELLVQAGHAPGWLAWNAADLGELAACDLVVLDCGQDQQETLQLCQCLRTRLSDRFLPVLLITAGGNPALRLAGFQCGAHAILDRPFVPEEFLAQANALLRLKRCHDRLAQKTADYVRVQQQLREAYQQMDQDLELSRRIQQRLLPHTLPDMPPAYFGVHHRPSGHGGGDSYDVFRLDEDHVGFYVADVVGHGVQASLLTDFLKRAVCFKVISGREYRLVPPHEVLQQFNRDLLGLAVSDNPFITMLYAVFDRRAGCLSFARAGYPPPLHVPRGREPSRWPIHGTMLGVFETEFTTQTIRLRPGDKVVLHSDGLEPSTPEGKSSRIDSLPALAARFRTLPVQEFVERVATELLKQADQPDDFTLLALEVRS